MECFSGLLAPSPLKHYMEGMERLWKGQGYSAHLRARKRCHTYMEFLYGLSPHPKTLQREDGQVLKQKLRHFPLWKGQGFSVHLLSS